MRIKWHCQNWSNIYNTTSLLLPVLQFFVSHIEAIGLDDPNTVVVWAVLLGQIFRENIQSCMLLSPIKGAGIQRIPHNMQPKLPLELSTFGNGFRSQIVAFCFAVKFELTGKLVLDMNISLQLPGQACWRQDTEDNEEYYETPRQQHSWHHLLLAHHRLVWSDYVGWFNLLLF